MAASSRTSSQFAQAQGAIVVPANGGCAAGKPWLRHNLKVSLRRNEPLRG